MYDEIVKDLREKAEFLAAAEPLHIKNAFAETMKQAADAIEELSKSRWIPVTEHLPDEFVSVQAHMTDAGPFPPVREAYLAGGKWYFPALNEYHPVDKWEEFSEPLKEDNHGTR